MTSNSNFVSTLLHPIRRTTAPTKSQLPTPRRPKCLADTSPSVCLRCRLCASRIPSAPPKTPASQSCPASSVRFATATNCAVPPLPRSTSQEYTTNSFLQPAGLLQDTTHLDAPPWRTNFESVWTDLLYQRRLRTQSTTTWDVCRSM